MFIDSSRILKIALISLVVTKINSLLQSQTLSRSSSFGCSILLPPATIWLFFFLCLLLLLLSSLNLLLCVPTPLTQCFNVAVAFKHAGNGIDNIIIYYLYSSFLWAENLYVVSMCGCAIYNFIHLIHQELSLSTEVDHKVCDSLFFLASVVDDGDKPLVILVMMTSLSGHTYNS